MSTRCNTCDGVGTVSGTKTHPGEMTPRHEKCPDCAPEPSPELSAELQGFVDDFAGGVCDSTCADAFSRLVDHAALAGSGLRLLIDATNGLDVASAKADSARGWMVDPIPKPAPEEPSPPEPDLDIIADEWEPPDTL